MRHYFPCIQPSNPQTYAHPAESQVFREEPDHIYPGYRMAYGFRGTRSEGLLATVNTLGQVTILYPLTGEVIRTFNTNMQFPSIFYGQDNTLVVSDYIGYVTIWDALLWTKINEFRIQGGTITYSPLGLSGTLSSGEKFRARPITIYNPRTGTSLRQGSQDLEISRLEYGPLDTPSENILAAGSRGGWVNIYNPWTGALLQTFNVGSEITHFAFDSKGNLGVGTSDGSVSIWNPISGMQLSQFNISRPDIRLLTTLVHSLLVREEPLQ